MKISLAVAVAVFLFSIALPAAADRHKGHHHYRGHDRTLIIHQHAHPRHYKHDRRAYHRGYRDGYRHGHRPHYYRHGPTVHNHYYRDDSYKWIGGMYILDELLHHHHH
ncbi:MAG: hypothetical protein WC997_12065 [Porticoccaceae bacterium]